MQNILKDQFTAQEKEEAKLASSFAAPTAALRELRIVGLAKMLRSLEFSVQLTSLLSKVFVSVCRKTFFWQCKPEKWFFFYWYTLNTLKLVVLSVRQLLEHTNAFGIGKGGGLKIHKISQH